jgi:hypothetical protein
MDGKPQCDLHTISESNIEKSHYLELIDSHGKSPNADNPEQSAAK